MSNDVVKEYCKKLSNDDLDYLRVRFKQNFCGDRADIANFLSRDEEVDNWLKKASDADEWFGMVDVIGERVESEYQRRYNNR